jgi:hypothetical protein
MKLEYVAIQDCQVILRIASRSLFCQGRMMIFMTVDILLIDG